MDRRPKACGCTSLESEYLDQGATVTARTSVSVYASGALVVQAFDDRLGLPFTDQTGTATVEGGASQTLDGSGRAALATALPQNWLLLQKPGFSPVWRSAALTVGATQTAVSARLTPLGTSQSSDGTTTSGTFGGNALQLALPAGAMAAGTAWSVTPLSSHGLPGLLPLGWSALSAWWLDLGGASLLSPGSASLNLAGTLAPASPALPVTATLAWAQWDPLQHAWVALAMPVSTGALAYLAVPAAGGYALLLADAGATAPPAPIAGNPVPGFAGTPWVAGLAATGSISPSTLGTAAAINGARATGAFSLAFGSLGSIPSATLIQADVLENYTLLDQSVIEPDVFTQDLVASPWLLETVNGAPLLTGISGGLGLHLPVRMSRTFAANQLVQGRILVGFYHDGSQLAQSGASLIGAAGGSVSQSGVTVTLGAGAVAGSTLVRISPDSGDLAALWPDLGWSAGSYPSSRSPTMADCFRGSSLTARRQWSRSGLIPTPASAAWGSTTTRFSSTSTSWGWRKREPAGCAPTRA